MKRFLVNFDILPRWVIFSLDVFIMTLGYLFATLIRFNFEVEEAVVWMDIMRMSVYLSANTLMMLIFQPYRRVIRYTQKEDTYAIIKTLVSAALLLALINQIFTLDVKPSQLSSHSIIIIAFLVNGALLMGYRFLVKEIFEHVLRDLRVKKRVVIYGAGQNGRLAARVMMEKNSHYHLLFFLDDDPSLDNTKLFGKKVMKIAESSENTLLAGGNIDELIIAAHQLDQQKRNWIIDLCLKNRIKIKEVPDPNQWVGGNLSERQFKEIRIEDLLGRPPINLASKNAIVEFSSKTILVTGAAGSIGSEISKQLLKCGVRKLLLLDQAESPLYDLYHDMASFDMDISHVEIIIGDVTREDQIEKTFVSHKPDIIFHAAAYKHVPLIEDHPIEGIQTNVLGTKYLADLAERYGTKKFIMISTDKAVNPTNIMGATKRAAESYIQAKDMQSDVDFITTRFGNVLGSNGSVIPLLTKQIRRGGPVTITHPDITRFFMTIPEACSLVLEAGAMAKGGEIFVFDMGEPIKILDLARKMIKLAGLEEGQDIEIKFIGLRPGEKLYEEVLSDLENTKKTHHPKIMIAEIIPRNLSEVSEMIHQLKEFIVAGDEVDLVKKLKQLVPEFKSKVSRFEVLDNKKAEN